MRVFARFQDPAEHEAMLDGILKARRLRHQIELYKHYRAMGLRTLEQVCVRVGYLYFYLCVFISVFVSICKCIDL